jgi:hypothetical protein
MKSHFLKLTTKTVSKWTQEATKAMMESYQHYFNKFQASTTEADEKRKITVCEEHVIFLTSPRFQAPQPSRVTR